MLEQIKQLVRELPPEGHRRLYALWNEVVLRKGKGKSHPNPSDQWVASSSG